MPTSPELSVRWLSIGSALAEATLRRRDAQLRQRCEAAHAERKGADEFCRDVEAAASVECSAPGNGEFTRTYSFVSTPAASQPAPEKEQ